MSVETQDAAVDIDLSKLIDIGLSFRPLQITIKDILSRLARLEAENAEQNQKIADLKDNVTELEEANSALQASQNALERAALAADTAKSSAMEKDMSAEEEGSMDHRDSEKEHTAIWEEMARLNGLLGELQDGAERDRHTIDEIYAARKQQNGAGASAGAPPRLSVSPAGHTSAAASVDVPHPSIISSDWNRASEEEMSASVSPKPHTALDMAEGVVPVGDVILGKAHEPLELLSEFSAFRESNELGAVADAAEEVGKARAHGAVQRSSLQPRRSSGVDAAQPRGGYTAVDGPYDHRRSSTMPVSRPVSSSQQEMGRPASTSFKGASPGSPLPWSSLAGGEEAGERREATAGSASQPLSSFHHPSAYAEKRMSVVLARRPSQQPNSGALEGNLPGASMSVFDKLRRDGDDIAYLNRVVAEILGEMRGLHEDVDLLRTRRDEADDATGKITAMYGDSSEDLQRRLARVEGDLVDVRQNTQFRDDRLQEELDALKTQLQVARSLTDADLDALRRIAELADRLRQLEERVPGLESSQGVLKEQLASILAIGDSANGGNPSEVNALQFAALQGAVKALENQLAALQAQLEGGRDWTDEIRKLNEAQRIIERDVEVTQDQLERLQKEASRLDEVKANRTELPNEALLAQMHQRGSATSADAATADVASRLSRAETNIQRLTEGKADRTALHKLRDDLNALRQQMELASDGRIRDGSEAADGSPQGASDGLLRDLQGELSALKETFNARFAGDGLSGNAADDLLGRIERLDHCKADATLVANKAERDYVENALERLMREVEQVLNATNAGLIDTLEKSLGILRDMIDGKATKQDVANLQGWMAEANLGGGAGAAGAPDGLTGFKGFRCLGCNRPMDNMRPRTLPPTMTPFLNRNPQNHPQDNVTRTIQQQAPGRAISGGGSAAQGSSTKAGSASANRGRGSPDASVNRSTTSEPLPPIEPM